MIELSSECSPNTGGYYRDKLPGQGPTVVICDQWREREAWLEALRKIALHELGHHVRNAAGLENCYARHLPDGNVMATSFKHMADHVTTDDLTAHAVDGT